ncbi:hypothetical protein BCT01_00755 [Vibrio tasmaniensis]|nr:hypothetical protein BCT01_00755 [Vibrio tasmaniensis]PMP10030.1 hypothetical protein BCS92_02335 [Vibrio tasmaniensis]
MNFFPITVDASITNFESPALDYAESNISIDELLIDDPNSMFFVRVSGDSMQGLRIFESDILVVNRKRLPEHLSIVVANYNGAFVVKRLNRHIPALVSIDYFGRESVVPITEDDTLQIEGVVTSTIRALVPEGFRL